MIPANTTDDLIRLIPTFIWAAVILVIIFAFRRVIGERLLPRLQGVEAFGVKATFVQEALDRVAETAPTGGSQERTQVARRAERLASILKGASALLVNDHPDEMRQVVELLEGLDIAVTTVTSTDAALAALDRRSFDVVISDMRRGSGETEGLRLIESSVRRGIGRPTILTVAKYEPERGTPPFAFGITNRVDELLNLVFDALERERG